MTLLMPKLASQDCADCPIRYRAVCSRCEADELQRLGDMKYYRSFQAGQSVIWSGDRMEFVASIVTGIATITQTMADGRRQMVGLLLPSDFVGRPGRDLAPYEVTAATDLGSGLIDHIQKMMIAAIAIADMNVWAQRS